MDHLRVVAPLGWMLLLFHLAAFPRPGWAGVRICCLSESPSTTSHQGKGRMRGPSSASRFCLCRLYQDEAPDSVGCPPLAPGLFGRGKVGMG